MYLEDDQLAAIRSLIRELYTESFSETSIQETGRHICSLLGADYFGLNIYPHKKIRQRMIITKANSSPKCK
jgi:hypothetical protein